VCRRWNEIIQRAKCRLPLRHLDMIRFTITNEWRAYVYYNDFKIRMRNSYNIHKTFHYYGREITVKVLSDQPVCGDITYARPKSYTNQEPVSCEAKHKEDLSTKAKMLHILTCPHRTFWKFLERKLRYSTSELLVFSDCYITPIFVRKFISLLKKLFGNRQFLATKLIIHGCSIQTQPVEQLHELFFKRIRAKHYAFTSVFNVPAAFLNHERLRVYESFRQATTVDLVDVLDHSLNKMSIAY